MAQKVYKSLSKLYPYERGYCIECDKLTTSKKGKLFVCKECQVGLEETINEEEQKILKLVKNAKLTPEEVRVLLKHKDERPVQKKQPYEVKATHMRIGVFGDTHIGSKFYDAKLMKYAASVFNQKDIDFVVHVGDITEGHYESKRAGSVLELTEIGGDAQVARAVKELSQIKKPIYGITGNHEHNTFYKLCGFDVGNAIQDKLPNFHYLGNMSAIIKLPFGKKLELLHPGGGSAYALSYRPQKIVESLEGGKKPDILLIGHYHKAMSMFYRNVHVVQTGTLQSQSSFMKEMGLAAHKGFYVLDIEVGKNGVKKFTPEFYPAY
jgi:predicted phosphodiesterase